jgi:hypothetical protein
MLIPYDYDPQGRSEWAPENYTFTCMVGAGIMQACIMICIMICNQGGHLLNCWQWMVLLSDGSVDTCTAVTSTMYGLPFILPVLLADGYCLLPLMLDT